jgi:hypothetical protein
MYTLHQLLVVERITQVLDASCGPTTADGVHQVLRATWHEVPSDVVFEQCLSALFSDGDVVEDLEGRLTLTESGRRRVRDGIFA